MMSDLDILRRLIKDEALAPVEDNYGRQALVLEEKGGQPQHAYDIKVHGIPDDTIAFKADKFPAPNAIFRGDKGECKRADFIIIANAPTANWIIYIEMKRGRSDSSEEIVQQLKGAECLVAYCRAIGRTFWKESAFLNEKGYQQRFVSIKNISVNKRPIWMPPKSGLHDNPEKMLKINSPGQNRLQFNRLIG